MMISVKQHSQIIYDINIVDEDLNNGVEILIGREEDCHIQLDSYLVSRYHAKILLAPEGVVLEVTSEYGGVFLRGGSIQRAVLNEGDKISISDFELVVSSLPLSQSTVSDEPDDDFSATEMIEKINDETVQIPAELEEMMDEFADVAESAPVEELEDATEMFAEEPIDGIDNLNQDLSPVEEDDDFLGGGLNDEFESANLGSDDLGEELDHDLDDEPLDGEDLGIENLDSEESTEELSAETDGFADDGFNQDDSFGDDGFGNDGFGEDGFGDEGNDGFGGMGGDDSGATQVFQSFAKFSLKIFGEYAPFDSYLLEDNETKIGRDPETCQIVLNDPEVSKVHAVIKKTLVNCILEDKESSNGIIYNGERVQKAELLNGDEFIIGDTTFTVVVKSDIIEAERDALMPVPEGQEVEIEEIIEEEVEFDEFEGGEGFGEEVVKEKSLLKRIWKDKRKRTYLIAVILIGALLFLLSEDPKPSQPVVTEQPKKEENKKDEKKYSAETLELLEQNYQLALARFGESDFSQAKLYIDTVQGIDPEYRDTQSLVKAIDEGLAEQKRIEEEKKRVEERLAKQIKVKGLVERARKAVDERNAMVARNLFNEISKLDPENLDVPPMKIELEAWEQEEQRKKDEEARKKALRQAMVEKLKPGKTAYIQEDWYQASEKLEKFIKLKDIDEDLLKEASTMLKDSRDRLVGMLNPLLSKARSFKEGQDLKQAYETYGEVLKLDPTNEEALNERDAIFTELNNRSKKIYREALVAESLSLFSKAKEKLQEVQQISPINSEYYKKATDKLKSYLE